MGRNISLADIVKDDAGTLTTADGKVHRVHPIGGDAFDLYYEAQQLAPVARVRAMYDIVALVAPTLDPAEVRKLSPRQVTHIVTLSMETADAVESTVPNADGPAAPATPA